MRRWDGRRTTAIVVVIVVSRRRTLLILDIGSSQITGFVVGCGCGSFSSRCNSGGRLNRSLRTDGGVEGTVEHIGCCWTHLTHG